MDERSLLVPQTRPEAPAVDVVAFPKAGAGASGFRGWRDVLPQDWRFTVVCLPGREESYGLPFATDMSDLADRVAAAVRTYRADGPAVPLVLLGDCMGSLLAFLVAHRLSVDALVTAACVPPGCLRTDPGDETLDEEALRSEAFDVLRAAGVHESVDDAMFAEMVDLMLPILTADVELVTTFRAPATPLACDIWALYGEDDQLDRAPWSAETTASAGCSVVAGSHSFVQESPHRVIDEMRRFLKVALAGDR